MYCLSIKKLKLPNALHPNNKRHKIQQKLYNKDAFNFSNNLSYNKDPDIFSNYNSYKNQNQKLNNNPITPIYKVDSYFNDYFNFNKSRVFYKPYHHLDINNYLSHSQDKQFYKSHKNSINFKYSNKEKDLFINSELNNNDYKLDDFLNDDMDINKKGNIFNSKYKNYNDIQNIMNYNNKKNTSFLSINSENNRKNYKNLSINTDNILNTSNKKNYYRNASTFNDNNKDNNYNNNAYLNIIYKKNSKTIDNMNDSKNNLSFFYNNYHLTNYNSTKNIKYKDHSETKHTFNKKSKINLLKERIQISDSNLGDNIKHSKSHEKKNIKDINDKNKENKAIEKINQNKNIKIKNSVINKIKNKINNEIQIKNYNDIKKITEKKTIKITHKFRTNNNSITNINKNYMNSKVVNNNSSFIKKENKILIKKYNIYDIIKKPKNIESSIPFYKNNLNPIKNSINSKNISFKYENENSKTNDNFNNKNEKRKQLLINKISLNNMKNININNIINKNSKTINNFNKKNKILIISKKSQIIRKITVNRKHESKILLSQLSKKECEKCHKLIDSHLFKIHYNSHPSQIFNWLYLGTFANACDIDELKRNKITYILNCALECINTKLPENIKELHLKIRDTDDFEIINYFEEANHFIQKCRKEGCNILVHCKFGISRSPSFIIAYLIKYNKLSVDEALKLVNRKRFQIKPNKGFINQLYRYKKYMLGKEKAIKL